MHIVFQPVPCSSRPRRRLPILAHRWRRRAIASHHGAGADLPPETEHPPSSVPLSGWSTAAGSGTSLGVVVSGSDSPASLLGTSAPPSVSPIPASSVRASAPASGVLQPESAIHSESGPSGVIAALPRFVTT